MFAVKACISIISPTQTNLGGKFGEKDVQHKVRGKRRKTQDTKSGEKDTQHKIW